MVFGFVVFAMMAGAAVSPGMTVEAEAALDWDDVVDDIGQMQAERRAARYEATGICVDRLGPVVEVGSECTFTDDELSAKMSIEYAVTLRCAHTQKLHLEGINYSTNPPTFNWRARTTCVDDCWDATGHGVCKPLQYWFDGDRFSEQAVLSTSCEVRHSGGPPGWVKKGGGSSFVIKTEGDVYYGAPGCWRIARDVKPGTYKCHYSDLGVVDPIPGGAKDCWLEPLTQEGPPRTSCVRKSACVQAIDGKRIYGNYSKPVNYQGMYAYFKDWSKQNFVVPDMRNNRLECDMIEPTAFFTERNRCLDGKRMTCSSLYQGSKIKSGRLKDLVPSRPVASYANQTSVRTNKDVIAINTSFFNTEPFAGRGKNWVPMIQEPCQVMLGSTKSNLDKKLLGTYGDRETFNGKKDRVFGSLMLKANGKMRLETTGNQDALAGPRDLLINGAWVRRNGRSINPENSSSLPKFVEEKFDSRVGRTAIGVNPKTNELAIVVIQPGVRGAFKGDGASARHIREMFETSRFPDVLLLDGSGSSQFATNFKLRGEESAPVPRSACLYPTLYSCSHRTMSVDKGKVESQNPSRFVQDPNAPNKFLSDRNVAGALVIYGDFAKDPCNSRPCINPSADQPWGPPSPDCDSTANVPMPKAQSLSVQGGKFVRVSRPTTIWYGAPGCWVKAKVSAGGGVCHWRNLGVTDPKPGAAKRCIQHKSTGV
ncbi:MAG: phosphodiester glycosidase family protein [Actinomycetota bacterium]